MSEINLEDEEKEIFNINFNNPFLIIFIHKLLKVLFNENNSQIKILETMINNMKNIQIFRSSQCFDLLYVLHNNEGTTLSCNNPSHSLLNYTNIKQLNNYDLKCCECKILIKIFFDNYKCIKCKLFVCNICSKKHYKSCYPSDLINLYDVGYTCEIHSKKYIDTFDMSNQNLCEKCKLYHYHIVQEQNHIILDEEKMKASINFNKLFEVKNYIKNHLLNRYMYMKKFNLKNIKIPKSLHFMVIKQYIKFLGDEFHCSSFFDKEFKQYYKLLIYNEEKGKKEECEKIQKIEMQ